MALVTLKIVWECLLSPRLVRVYSKGAAQHAYEPASYEKLGDQVIYSLNIIWRIGVYTSPILVGILYYRQCLTTDSLPTISKFLVSLGLIVGISHCCRGWGRYNNPVYRRFMDTLVVAKATAGAGNVSSTLPKHTKMQLSKYEFDFGRWPIEFRQQTSSSHSTNRRRQSQQFLLAALAEIPFRVIAYIAIHTFGIRLIYPGTLGMLHIILDQGLVMGRTKLIETYKGERFKLRTIDGNDIDTMFVDRRGRSGHVGNTLVICCEGNAGFYEIGIMSTPIEAGYSVLGWNHPGFGGSTGTPYPSQEQNAIDTVMQFATNMLKFSTENILLFGWSIGGYTTSWAAKMYPDIRGVILDASFDDILPLAVAHMPGWWKPIVRIAIREHVNLNVAEQLCQFPGPVLLIRRTDDEVICLRENDVSSNRGNYLLVKLLSYRYPVLFSDRQLALVNEYLAYTGPSQDEVLRKFAVDSDTCQNRLESYASEHGESFPMGIGVDLNDAAKNELVLFLAHKHMLEYKSTHCTNLLPELFRIPWAIRRNHFNSLNEIPTAAADSTNEQS